MIALKEIRERMNLTQAAVAREIGVSRQTYNNWELGKRQADYESLLKLAELLDTTVENILTGCLEPSPLTESQEHLAKLVEDTHPEGVSPVTSIAMNGAVKQKVPLSFDTREEAIKYFRSLPDADFTQLEVFAEYLTYRRNRLPE